MPIYKAYVQCNVKYFIVRILQACQQTEDQTMSYSLGRFIDISWTVTNADDPDKLQFDVSYGGGDVAGGMPR